MKERVVQKWGDVMLQCNKNVGKVGMKKIQIFVAGRNFKRYISRK